MKYLAAVPGLPSLGKKPTRSAVVLLYVLASLPAASFALNPVMRTMYTADPAPMVHDGAVYLFSSHDEDVGEPNNFNMKDWVLATATDMASWTQHGAVASLQYRRRPHGLRLLPDRAKDGR